ncbi:MAG: twin-arginine translocase subunit TatB [Methylobacteriaceae bacterium]|nr:twin-arginine translocase subunit TatB [Methylobacteriaceae bacterium]MBV9244034.1 twin-arginine translocase subunit TatB [Methylobacteriaceae bacterium]
MLDIDAGKLLIVGIVALLVIGPKELPRVLRQLGQWTGKMRRMANEFRGQFMDAMREADLESIKKEVAAVGDAAQVDVAFDPVADVRREMTGALEAKPGDAGAAPALPPPTDGAAPASAAVEALSETAPASAMNGSETVVAAHASTEPPRSIRHDLPPEAQLTPGVASSPNGGGSVTVPIGNGHAPVPAPSVVRTSRSEAAGASTQLRTERADAIAAAARRRTQRTNALASAALRKRPAYPVVPPGQPDPTPAPKPEG